MGWFDKVKANTAVAIAISPIGNAIKGAKMVADGAKVAVEATGNFVEYFGDNPKRILPCVGQGLISGVTSVAAWGADGGRFVLRQAWNNNPATLIARGASWGVEKTFDVDMPSLKWEKPEQSFGDSWEKKTTFEWGKPQSKYEAVLIGGVKAVPEAVAITAAVVLTAGTAAPVLIASGAPAVVITAATATANIANATSKVGVVSNIAMASTVPIGIDAPLSGVGAGSEYMQIEAEAAMLQDLAFGDINTPAENDLNTTTPGTVLPPENIGGPFKGAASPDLIAKNDAPTISAASQIDPTSSGETLTASFFQVAPSDEIRDLLKGTTLEGEAPRVDDIAPKNPA